VSRGVGRPSARGRFYGLIRPAAGGHGDDGNLQRMCADDTLRSGSSISNAPSPPSCVPPRAPCDGTVETGGHRHSALSPDVPRPATSSHARTAAVLVHAPNTTPTRTFQA
jgi:hypothetical protein